MIPNPTLLPQFTNRETFVLPVAVTDKDTGAPIDLVGLGATIQFEVRKPGQNPMDGGYATFYDIGTIDPGPILTASIGNGITITDVGVFLVTFTETQMRSLRPGTYNVGCTVTVSGDTRQIIRGRLPIFDGFVTT